MASRPWRNASRLCAKSSTRKQVAKGALPPLTDRLAAGVARANEALDSGAAQATLDRWIEATSRMV